MKTSLYSAPTVEPVTITEVQRHLRITNDDDNLYLSGLVTVARQWAEAFTGRCFVEQTWDEWFSGFPVEKFVLSKMPLVSVTGVYYTDYAEVTTALVEGTDYLVDSNSVPGEVILCYGATWPTFTPSVKPPVKIRYVAGYAKSSSGDSPPVYDYRVNVPKDIKQALLLIVGHLYNNRENTIAGVGLADIPFGAEYLLWPHRMMTL